MADMETPSAAIEGLSLGVRRIGRGGKYERGVLRFKKRKRERKNNTSMRRMGDQVLVKYGEHKKVDTTGVGEWA